MTHVGPSGQPVRRAVPARPPTTSLRSRLREPAFWHVQAGVVGITALHWLVEASGLHETQHGPLSSLLDVSVVLYLLPVVYAGLRYGFEGSLWTGVSVALLATPNQFLWHTQDFEWVGEIIFIGLVIAIGAVIAIPVEREQQQRARAEMAHHRATVAGHRLQLMNDVTSMLVRTADMEDALGGVLHRMVDTMPLDAAAVVAWTGPEPTPTALACHELDPGGLDRLRAAVRDLDTQDLRPGTVYVHDDEYLAPFTLEDEDTRVLVVRSQRPLHPAERQLLAAIGRQVGVALDNLRMHHEQQHALHLHLQGVTRAQEEERRRIARDLHDVATHELLLVRRDLEQPSPDTGDPQSVGAPGARRAHDRLGAVIDTLRKFSRDLRPSVLDPLGLAPALEWLATQTNDRQAVAVHSRVAGTPRRLEPEAELALYRIAEEALRNATQHANASRVDLQVTFAPDHVHLTVDDNGKGLPEPRTTPASNNGHGLGIPGMSERASLIGARIVLSSGTTGGTRVQVELPTPPR